MADSENERTINPGFPVNRIDFFFDEEVRRFVTDFSYSFKVTITFFSLQTEEVHAGFYIFPNLQKTPNDHSFEIHKLGTETNEK
jgi:hypothetical protein